MTTTLDRHAGHRLTYSIYGRIDFDARIDATGDAIYNETMYQVDPGETEVTCHTCGGYPVEMAEDWQAYAEGQKLAKDECTRCRVPTFVDILSVNGLCPTCAAEWVTT